MHELLLNPYTHHLEGGSKVTEMAAQQHLKRVHHQPLRSGAEYERRKQCRANKEMKEVARAMQHDNDRHQDLCCHVSSSTASREMQK